MIKSFPFVHQYDKMDCGPACIRMIAKFYGKNYSMSELREKCHISKQGVNLLGMSLAAEKIGFRTRGVRFTLERFKKETIFPCIIHWNRNHFVVCYEIIRKHKIYYYKIADPAHGILSYHEEEFKQLWISQNSDNDIETGAVLILEPTPTFYNYEDISNNTFKNFSYFFKYLVPYKSDFSLLILCLIITSILQLIFPLLTQSLVDVGIGTSNLNFIELILIAQLTIFTSRLSVEFIHNWIALHINSRISIHLISDFLSKLMRLPLSFFDSKQIGDLMQRIGDHARIRNLLTGTSINTIFSLWIFVIFGGLLVWYNYKVFLIFVLGNILYIGWVTAFLKKRRDLDYKRFTEASKDQSNLVQLITGIEEIKLNNSENQKRWKWESIQVRLFRVSLNGLALGQIQQVGSLFFVQTTNILITYLVAKSVVDGLMTLGMMMSITYILGQLNAPIGQLISLIQDLQDAKISLERLSEIHVKKDEDDFISLIHDIKDDYGIFVENINFSYTGLERNSVLKNLSFKIPKNKVTAIVGASGSGKTTLMKLLLGFYNPTSGKIKIGKNSLQDINPHSWRECTGAVLQDGFIFSESILDNIAVEVEEVDYSRMEEAIEMAQLKDFIEALPLGIHTKIGMEGNGISQGQKQRILIARAIYKNPDYLFFDEATNSLDSTTEKNILKYLHNFYKGKTVVIIAHRLSTVQNADNIIVLENGTLIEEGTHKQLVDKKSAYFELVKNQLEIGN